MVETAPSIPQAAPPPERRRGVILLAEDDASVLAALAQVLEAAGFQVLRAASGREALLMLSDKVHLLITDLWMPQMDGLALLEEVRRRKPLVEAVVITGNATVASAVQAMKAGAFDYITKPFTPPDLLDVVERAIENGRVRRDIAHWGSDAVGVRQLEKLIGNSPGMLAVAQTIRRVAPFKSTVLVEGESGTGKEMVVRAIHELSPRQSKPFIAVNCAAVPASLMESELFGHTRGAFTGASAQTTGYFEAANGGTLFIDEVGELELAVQAKLLRVLETGMVTPVGSTREKPIDVRVVAATNSDLQTAVEAKRFRADLFYRLNVVRVTLPPLRQRVEDIPLLVGNLIERLCAENGLPAPTVEPSLVRALQAYSWPGNVRELRNVLENMLVMAQKPVLTSADLPEYIHNPQLAPPPGTALDLAEKAAIENALRQHQGNRAHAAAGLAISVRTLYRKMAQYGLR
ncbi:MAG: sigma-54-dependent transcriptional regulator [Phycisphaerae bacterium]